MNVTAKITVKYRYSLEGTWATSIGIEFLCTYLLYGAKIHKKYVKNLIKKCGRKFVLQTRFIKFSLVGLSACGLEFWIKALAKRVGLCATVLIRGSIYLPSVLRCVTIELYNLQGNKIHGYALILNRLTTLKKQKYGQKLAKLSRGVSPSVVWFFCVNMSSSLQVKILILSRKVGYFF